MKKNKKKKILVIALLFFAIIGVTAYGVYSYYWTQGEFGGYGDGESNKIRFTGSFNPWAGDIQGGSYTIGYGGTITMTCTEPDSNHEVSCSGSTTIHNDGSTAVDIEVFDSTYYSGSYVGSYTPSFNWTSARISAGSSKELTVYATTTLETGVDSSNAEEVSSAVSLETYVGASFSLRATQVH